MSLQRPDRRARTGGRVVTREVAPSIQSRFQQRRIAPEANPLQGLSEGATRLSWRMNQLGAELGQQFGAMANNFARTMNIEAEKQLFEAQEERGRLINQAQLDHIRGNPDSSEARSYRLERERLRANDQMQDEVATRTAAGRLRNGRAAEFAFQFFINKGYNEAQAAAIVGHLNAESSWRTDARNPRDGRDGSDSIGLLQWNSSRAQALKAFAAQKGTDWRDMTTQLEYLDYELKNTRHAFQNDRTRSQFLNARTVEEATTAFMHAVRPGGYTPQNPRGGSNFDNRLFAARQALRSGWSRGPVEAPDGSSTGGGSGSADGVEAQGPNTAAQVRRNMATAREAAAGTGDAISRIQPGQGITDTMADQAAGQIVESFVRDVLPKVTLEQGYSGSTQALNAHALQIMKGLDENQQGAILAKVEDRSRRFRDQHFANLNKQQRETNQSNFENETTRLFLDGQLTKPEDVQGLVTRAQDPLIYGDARVARQTVTRNIIGAAVSAMQENPATAQETYTRAMQALEPTFTQFPADTQDLRVKMLDALRRANQGMARSIVTKMQSAADQGDANTVVTTLFDNYGTIMSGGQAEAVTKAFESLGQIAQQRATQAQAAAYVDGRPTVGEVDPKAIEQEVDRRFGEAIQKNDAVGLQQLINGSPVVTPGIRRQMSMALRPQLFQPQNWRYDAEKREMTGAGVEEFNQRFGLLASLDRNARERALDPDALAVFNATQTMATGMSMSPAVAFQKVIERQKQLGPQEFQRLVRDGLKTNEVYTKSPSGTPDEQFEAMVKNVATRIGNGGVRQTVNLSTADFYAVEADIRRAAGSMFAASGEITEADMEKAAERVLRERFVPVATGYSRWSGTTISMRRVDPVVARQWEASGLSRQPEKLVELTDRARTALPHGVPTGPVNLMADEEARNGYLSVRDGNYMMPILVEPGSVRQNPQQTGAAGRVSYPADRDAFLQQIARENASMATTGYQWLEQGNNRYKLVFRPSLMVEARAEDPRVILGQDLNNIEDALNRRNLGITRARMGTMDETYNPARYLVGMEQTPGGQLANMVREVVGRASSGPNAVLPRNLGVTIPVPDTFESPQAAMDWLRKAQVTHRLNYANARPTTDPNFGVEMRQRMQERYGNFLTPRPDADAPNTAYIGARVNLDDAEVRTFLRERMNMSDRTITALREGKPVGDPATWPERRERIASAITDFAVGKAETTLKSKVNPESLAGLPPQAYSVLVGLAYENPTLVTKDMASAIERKEWRTVERMIREAVPKSSNRNIAAATRHYRGIDADLFVMSLGLNP